jgi:hypothetical protein
MACFIPTKEEGRRFTAFTQELTALSKVYGFVLQVVGGVITFETEDADLQVLRYTNDLSSGDLMPVGIGQEEDAMNDLPNDHGYRLMTPFLRKSLDYDQGLNINWFENIDEESVNKLIDDGKILQMVLHANVLGMRQFEYNTSDFEGYIEKELDNFQVVGTPFDLSECDPSLNEGYQHAFNNELWEIVLTRDDQIINIFCDFVNAYTIYK